MTSGTVKELEKFLKTSGSGRKFLQGMTFFVAHGKLYVIKALERFREKTVDKQQQIDKVIIKRFPQTGDRIHGKSRSKYCNNHQIPLFWRNFIPISVEHGNDIHSTVPNKRSDHYTPEF